ncbi:MAG: 2-amino-4-hydroxy-6-hydroxymethyldihydropteridine diphosphokinase [Candidatus Omnitrophica bacterium]|nr:2-amino-4-hydroxy-6-hydroxymethyldihydropteridine diphosphokinase [Candidatus Omnitrophota bacterium]
MVLVYLGIGSNIGNRRGYIKQAINKLRQTDGIKVLKVSSLIETEPIGGPKQGKFLNGAIKIQTSLPPYRLLRELKKIEKELGRLKAIRNAPRIIDLDILLYGDRKINLKTLKIPHPRMYKRAFVVKPLKEIKCSL